MQRRRDRDYNQKVETFKGIWTGLRRYYGLRNLMFSRLGLEFNEMHLKLVQNKFIYKDIDNVQGEFVRANEDLINKINNIFKSD